MFDMELDRLSAEAGCGIPELRFKPPSVFNHQHRKSGDSQPNSLLVAGAR